MDHSLNQGFLVGCFREFRTQIFVAFFQAIQIRCKLFIQFRIVACEANQFIAFFVNRLIVLRKFPGVGGYRQSYLRIAGDAEFFIEVGEV